MKSPMVKPIQALHPSCLFRWLAFLSVALPAAWAQNETKSGDTVALPTFTVEDNKGDPYRASDVTSLARTAGSIVDTPLTVNVVTQELIMDLGANSGYDVDRYFAGVSNGRGAGIAGISDRQNFRGFEGGGRVIDNFATNGFQANLDPALIERQELVMGPDTILAPTGTPGGTLNVITKSPKFAPETTISASGGNINSDKVVFDTTGPINNKLAYRFVTSYQDTPTSIPGSLHGDVVAGMLTYNITQNAHLDVRYFHEDWRQKGESANANDWGEMVYTPDTLNATISNTAQPGFGYNSWNGSATWGHRDDHVDMAEIVFTAPLFNLISMRLGGSYMSDAWTQDSAYPSIAPGEKFDPDTGLATAITLPSTFSLTAMPVVGQYAKSLTRIFMVQNDYAANLHPGSVSVQPSVGWSIEQNHGLYSYSAQDKSAVDLPPVDLLLNNGAQVIGADQQPPLSHYTSSPSNTPAITITKQIYALTKVGIFDNRVYLMGGASRVFINNTSYRTTATVPNGNELPTFVGPYSQTILDSKRDTYLGGFVLKPTTNTSLYYSYSSNAGLTSYNNQPLWQTGKQQEFGAKAEFYNQRLQITADHFAIRQLNLSTPNPAFNLDTSQPPNILGNATSNGYELNVVGSIAPNLSIIGSFTDMKYRDTFGRRVRNVPDHLGSLLLTYRFPGSLKGSDVFVGAVHNGNVAGETISGSTPKGVPEQPSFYVPGWTVINAGAGYTWGRYRITVNLDNVLDKQFFWAPAGRGSVPMYDGLAARSTIIVRF